jgi:hypothetical protein
LKHVARPVDAGTRVGFGHGHGLCDLGVGPLLDLAQHEGNAVGLGQGLNRFLYECAQLTVADLLVCGSSVLSPGGQAVEQAKLSCPARSSVGAGVGEDAAQPGTQLEVASETL